MTRNTEKSLLHPTRVIWYQNIVKQDLIINHQLVSGLKINFAKSSFGAIGKSEQWKKVAAKYLNCRLLNNEEDAAHLFFNCSKTLPIWWESMSWVNILGAFLQNPRHHFLQHAYGGYAGLRAHRWQCWWIALTWTIWQHRNRIVFSNDSFNGSNLMDNAIFLCLSWFRNMEKGFVMHFNQWLSNLREGFCNQGTEAYIGLG
ncbi:hypothetical protein GmHk_06G016067 [Glycine max]|nr:hypothetical protein GmHk_06G016067 [Glycine max]